MKQYKKSGESRSFSFDGIDGAHYGRTDTAQYLLLRDGGVVLLYRTDAPDDLRAHLDDFSALLESDR